MQIYSRQAEASKYRSIITNAINADGIVKERYGQHKEGIELMSLSDVSILFFAPLVFDGNWTLTFQADLERALPSSGPVAGGKSSPAVQELRKLMDQVEAIKNEREVIESELKEANFDMSN